MPKRRLFNLRNLGSWAGIKKKNNNGEPEATDSSDKENVRFLLYSPMNSPSLIEHRYPQIISFLTWYPRLASAVHSKLLESQCQLISDIHPFDQFFSNQTAFLHLMYS